MHRAPIDRRRRENDLCGPQRCDDAGDNRRGPIRAQADCAAASIMKGRSALLGGRKPSVVASLSAWLVIVCGRAA
jgi:hypothetical protein